MTREEFIAKQTTAWLGELYEAMYVARAGQLAIGFLKAKGADTTERIGLLYDEMRTVITHELERKNAQDQKQQAGKQSTTPGAGGQGKPNSGRTPG